MVQTQDITKHTEIHITSVESVQKVLINRINSCQFGFAKPKYLRLKLDCAQLNDMRNITEISKISYKNRKHGHF